MIVIDQPMHKVHLAFADLSHALDNGNASYKWHRRVFLDACLQYIQSVEEPALNSAKEEHPKAYLELLEIREPFLEWILRDSIINEDDFSSVLVPFFGKLRSETVSYGDVHKVFTKDLFLYTVAALIQAENFSTLGGLFHNSYFIQGERGSHYMYFPDFDCATTTVPIDGSLLKENPTPLITFHELMQAELLCVFASCFWESKTWYSMTWYPRLLVHAEDHALFELFQRMSSRSFYDRVKVVVPDMPSNMVEQGVGLTNLVCERLRRVTQSLGRSENRTWKSWMNLEKLGSVD